MTYLQHNIKIFAVALCLFSQENRWGLALRCEKCHGFDDCKAPREEYCENEDHICYLSWNIKSDVYRTYSKGCGYDIRAVQDEIKCIEDIESRLATDFQCNCATELCNKRVTFRNKSVTGNLCRKSSLKCCCHGICIDSSMNCGDLFDCESDNGCEGDDEVTTSGGQTRQGSNSGYPQTLLVILGGGILLALILLGHVLCKIQTQLKCCFDRHSISESAPAGLPRQEDELNDFDRHSISESAPAGLPPQEDELDDLKLLLEKGSGRFGSVWLGEHRGQRVAVKVFSSSEVKSWKTERKIYNLDGFNHHDNILHYLGCKEETVEGFTKYCLVMDFQENGSLYDYLIDNVVSLPRALKMARDVANGLGFIHSYTHSPSGKPPVAHRDVKSRNILVGRDLTCCVSDFGLAMIIDEGFEAKNVSAQVGTVRYLAPEVLEGYVTFTLYGFTAIDVYAAGLVLWEIVSRCAVDDENVGEYLMPYEAELGINPAQTDLYQAVVVDHCRPPFKTKLLKNEEVSFLCETIAGCWELDPYHRLTADCVVNRIDELLESSSACNPSNVTM